MKQTQREEDDDDKSEESHHDKSNHGERSAPTRGKRSQPEESDKENEEHKERSRQARSIPIPLTEESPQATPSLHNCVTNTADARRELKYLIQTGVLTKTTGIPYLKAMLLPKKKGGCRLVVDGKEAATRNINFTKSYFPTSTRDAIRKTVKESIDKPFMGTLDLKNGYYNCLLAKADKMLTVRINNQTYNCQRPLQGLPNSGSLCSEIFAKFFTLSGATTSYSDNAVYHGRTRNECRRKVKKARTYLESLGFTINPEQTILSSNEIPFLGVLIRNGEAVPTKKNLKNLTNPEKTPKQRQGYKSYLHDIFGDTLKINYKRTITIYADGAAKQNAAAAAFCDDCTGVVEQAIRPMPSANQVHVEAESCLLAINLAKKYLVSSILIDAKYLTRDPGWNKDKYKSKLAKHSSLCSIVTSHAIDNSITPNYVPSAQNQADPLSRGMPLGLCAC